MQRVHEAQISAPLPSRCATRGMFTPIDLTPAANACLADAKAGDGRGLLDLGRGLDLSFMEGDAVLNGVPFRIGAEGERDLVVLENRGALDPRFAQEIRIPVDREAASLVFLHTLTRPLPWTYSAQLTYIGTYLVEYDDGTRTAYPIRYKRNILEWDALDAGRVGYKSSLVTVPGATPAYRGTTPSGKSILLLAAEWVNPFPQKRIASIVMRSTSRMFGTRVALFGLTAVSPTERDVSFWAERKPEALPDEPPRPDLGGLHEIDLAGGKFISDTEYEAPDGTKITASASYTLKGATLIAFMKVGYVTVDNNLGWQVYEHKPQTLTITFPTTRRIAGVSVLGLPETAEYVFVNSPSPMDYIVEVSQAGRTWQEAAKRRGYLPDRDLDRVHVFAPQSAKAIRVTIAPTSRKGCLVRGLARVRLFGAKP